MKKQLLTIPEEIREYLSYDELTGILTWIKQPAACVYIGTKAGCIVTTHSGKQYIHIKFRKRSYRAHRVIWFIKTGKQPQLEIDHKDSSGLNNKWDNLREATDIGNAQNSIKPKTNTSGYKGVSWHNRDKKYHAQISVNYEKIHLGYFDDPELAYATYCKAADELHGEFANYG